MPFDFNQYVNTLQNMAQAQSAQQIADYQKQSLPIQLENERLNLETSKQMKPLELLATQIGIQQKQKDIQDQVNIATAYKEAQKNALTSPTEGPMDIWVNEGEQLKAVAQATYATGNPTRMAEIRKQLDDHTERGQKLKQEMFSSVSSQLMAINPENPEEVKSVLEDVKKNYGNRVYLDLVSKGVGAGGSTGVTAIRRVINSGMTAAQVASGIDRDLERQRKILSDARIAEDKKIEHDYQRAKIEITREGVELAREERAARKTAQQEQKEESYIFRMNAQLRAEQADINQNIGLTKTMKDEARKALITAHFNDLLGYIAKLNPERRATFIQQSALAFPSTVEELANKGLYRLPNGKFGIYDAKTKQFDLNIIGNTETKP